MTSLFVTKWGIHASPQKTVKNATSDCFESNFLWRSLLPAPPIGGLLVLIVCIVFWQNLFCYSFDVWLQIGFHDDALMEFHDVKRNYRTDFANSCSQCLVIEHCLLRIYDIRHQSVNCVSREMHFVIWNCYVFFVSYLKWHFSSELNHTRFAYEAAQD